MCGLIGSGKGIVRSLLDGHTNILNVPFQSLAMSLLTPGFADFCSRRYDLASLAKREPSLEFSCRFGADDIPVNIAHFITFLFTHDMMSGVLHAGLSKRIYSYSSETDVTSGLFDFDYEKFVGALIRELREHQKTFNVEELQELVYRLTLENWKNYRTIFQEYSSYLISSANGKSPIESITNTNQDYKIVILTRDPIGLCYTNAKRLVSQRNLLGEYTHPQKTRFFGLYSSFDNSLYNKGFIERVMEFNRYAGNLASKNERVMLLDFDELIFSTNDSMDKVLKFLKLELEPIAYVATRNKESTETENIKFTGTINDDHNKGLDSTQIDTLRFLLRLKAPQRVSFTRRIKAALNAFKYRFMQDCMQWKRKLSVSTR